MVNSGLEIGTWAARNFGGCELGDARRTERLVKYAAQVAEHPEAGTPDQTRSWADCRAAYRLFDREEVTFDSVCETHWRTTREEVAERGGTFLLIGDTTEVAYGTRRKVTGLGPLGNGKGRGFLLHSSLAVDADSGEIVGLTGAELFVRTPAPKEESQRASRERSRESEVWGRVIDRVGPPPEGARYVHVLDAGADNFEVFLHLAEQRCDWVVRWANRLRDVLDAAGNRVKLQNLVAARDCSGTYELKLRSRPKSPARTARIEVRHVPFEMPQPRQRTPYVRERDPEPIPMWAVEVREVDAPEGIEPLHWVLLTSERVDDFDAAWRVIGWYEQRPVVEDYHECLKTGCKVESRQYATAARLAGGIGLSTVVAARLLQLKFVARTNPGRPSRGVVPTAWVTMVRALHRGRAHVDTVGGFFRSLAMLGGFLGRKHDGDPGWMTIWRGFRKLTEALRGAEAVGLKCG